MILGKLFIHSELPVVYREHGLIMPMVKVRIRFCYLGQKSPDTTDLNKGKEKRLKNVLFALPPPIIRALSVKKDSRVDMV